jgi:hypothetical protein
MLGDLDLVDNDSFRKGKPGSLFHHNLSLGMEALFERCFWRSRE